MTLPFEKLQERLTRHFESLARTRADSAFPIFALEHGLREDELDEISSVLRYRVKAGLPLPPHWLLWVIYATERGYSYTGDEYWRSFEEQTPEWEFEDRYQIVPWFRKFQQAYHGVEPSGPWAGHFRIIAWPITHAILPRYLQREFTRALYDLRFRLATFTTLDPRAVGRLLAANAYHTSARFQEFLQQEELAGRIVLALLGAEPSKGKEPIYPLALRRIVSDLENVRSAREWLRETKRVVADRFKGIGFGTGPLTHPHVGPAGRPASDATHFSVRPNLLLRHAGAGTWSVLLEVPSFRSVPALNVDMQAFLQRTRCRLNGGSDVKPAGWLLSGNRKGILKSWPNALRPLIQFEQPYSAIDHLLEFECRLSPGPVWLFRIASDGTAREIIGRIVRPGCSYIVVTTGELPQSHACMTPCSVDCEGVKSFRLAIPPEVSVETTAWLRQLRLQVARTIRVWPAGLPGRGWDGEGRGEWLTTEAPCFGIAHDHPVDAYALRLNIGPEIVIQPGSAGRLVFVRIAPLPVGTHYLTVKTRRSAPLDALAPSPPAIGSVQLDVREPEPWLPSVTSHPGLIVTLDPHDPDLDTFWRNKVSLSVIGPEGYAVAFTVRFQSVNGHEILSEQVGAPMDLPITPDAWRQRFAQFLQREEYGWSYLEAAVGFLTIKGDTLGEASFRFEHAVKPLRWLLSRNQKNISVRLVDDTGQEGTGPEVLYFSMDNPLRARRYEPQQAFLGLNVEPPGGLFVAKKKKEKYLASVIVSTGLSAEGFSGLSVNPQFPDLLAQPARLSGALRLLGLWRAARQFGFLAGIRRQQVADSLTIAIYRALCGPDWGKAEAAFKDSRDTWLALENLQRSVGKPPSFAAVLRQGYLRMNGDLSKASIWFADVAARYNVSKDRRLCGFALRLASQPHRLPRLFGPDLDALLIQIRENPTILRGARLLALVSANSKLQDSVRLLPKWNWSSPG